MTVPVWLRTVCDMELDRRPLRTLGHPQVQVLVLAGLKEDDIVAALSQACVSLLLLLSLSTATWLWGVCLPSRLPPR